MASKITILGAGPGGYVAAIRAAQLGAEVTLVEADQVGGTCLNRGCIPSKVLITTAALLEKFHRAESFGVKVDGRVSPDLAKLMDRKKNVIQGQIKGILGLLKRHKIRLCTGIGQITGPGKIRVTPRKGDEIDLDWDRLILATGTEPLNIPAFPFDGKKIISSDHVLALEEIPESVLILGGGVIGCEFAFILSSLGARVTVVEALSRLLPLPSVDESCSKILQREMKKRRIRVLVDKTVADYAEDGAGLKVTVGPSPFLENPSDKDKTLQPLEVDKMLVCIGRHPNSAGLGLENIGIETDEKGWIAVDEHMQTDAENIYAVGDILGTPKVMLAHVASAEGLVAAENAMGANYRVDYHAVPGAIFTSPEVANVGLTEAQAKERGVACEAHQVLMRTLGKAQVMGELAGEARVIVESDSGRILGIHLVGAHVTELIAEGTLAVQHGMTVNDIVATIHAHPTLAEIMLEVAHKAKGYAIHG
ncbi:MAG: dihydrolipoyl dehydrogenase [Deltaproteobacteria bacterium]|nr:MAG: dihydrolipoyl dehydrogenase [Deltaproteobacteria bacterium]